MVRSEGVLGLLVMVVALAIVLAAIGMAVLPYIDRAVHILN